MTRVDVEGDDLAGLLADLGRAEDAAAIGEALASGDLHAALPVLATVLARMHGVDDAPDPTRGLS